MDLTQLFKASVKTVRLRNKSINPPDKSRILKMKTRDDFLITAFDVRYQVTQLRDFLLENRAAYMRLGFHLKTSKQMTDEERNIIDQESEKIFTLCNQKINDLQAECLKQKTSSQKQFVDHKLALLDNLSDYLKGVFKIHKEQKNCRIQHESDTFKLLKLESSRKLKAVIPKKKERFEDQAHGEDERDLDDQKQNSSISSNSSKVAVDEDQAYKFSIEDDSLNADDIQMFESENTQLLKDFQGLSDEVEQIEKNVVGIAKLQEIFTEKVP